MPLTVSQYARAKRNRYIAMQRLRARGYVTRRGFKAYTPRGVTRRLPYRRQFREIRRDATTQRELDQYTAMLLMARIYGGLDP